MRNIEELKDIEMEELIKDYKRPSSEITLTQIIDKYDLDIKTSQLVKYLPAQVTDNRCPYCNELMVARIMNRKEMGYPYCEKCGHTLYPEQQWSRWKKICECQNCQKAQKEDQEVKKNMINSVYTNKNELFDVDDLSLKDIVSLLKIIKECLYEKSKIYFGHKYNKYKADARELRQKGVISVSPTSPIKAFPDDDFPFTFYPSLVIFDINVKLNSNENIDNFLEYQIAKAYANATAEEKYDLFINIMHHDILEHMRLMMYERGLDFVVLSNAEDSLKTLYDKLSYGQIINLCFRVARYYLDNTKTGKIYKNAAAKGALKTVVTFYENSIKRDGK